MSEKISVRTWKWFNYTDGRKLLSARDYAVIHCPDAPMTVSERDQQLIASAPELLSALEAIYTAVRGDEKSECWTIRKWLDERDIFNDDIQGTERLIEMTCRAVCKAKP